MGHVLPAKARTPAKTGTAVALAATSAPAVAAFNAVQAAIPTPPAIVAEGPDVVADFLTDVRVDGEHWIWTGEVSRRGYGVHVVEGVRLNARRAAHYLLLGADYPGVAGVARVDVTCPEPACVNPEHLTVA